MHKLCTSALLHRSLQLCKSRSVLFTAGVLLFGSLSAVSSLWMEAGNEDIVRAVLEPLRQSGVELSALSDALENGTTEETLNVLMALQTNPMTGLEALSMLDTLMPVVRMMLWSALLSLLIATLSSLYFLCALAVRSPSVSAVITRFFITIPSMLLIALWSSLRSFVWVPLLGPWIGIFLLPRFLFAPVLSVRDNLNVPTAVRESYRQTKGGTWYVLSGLSMISLVALLAAVPVILLAAFTLDPLLGSYSVFLRSMIWQTVIGFSIAGLVVMWSAGEEMPVNALKLE